MRRGLIVAAGSVALVVVFRAAAAEERTTLREAANQLEMGWVEEYVTGEILDGFALPSPDEWRRFWTSIQKALESESLEDLAWMLPEAERALTILDSVEGGKPYADWLRQRLDYFDLAGYVTAHLPAEAGPTPPFPVRTPVTRRAVIVPPPSPPPAKIPEAVARERVDAVSSVTLWKEKLAGRPPPERAKKLAPALKEIFREEGIPPELVWQAEVESSFNPEARSPAGARGLFQFMPATARSYGLRAGPPDERLNPNKSARAAARYLKTLYRRFNSWPLTLAAYNAGEGRVGRVLKKNRVNTFAGAAPYLPAETRMYVPKVLATVYHREGIEPENLPPPAGS